MVGGRAREDGGWRRAWRTYEYAVIIPPGHLAKGREAQAADGGKAASTLVHAYMLFLHVCGMTPFWGPLLGLQNMNVLLYQLSNDH